MNFFKTVSFIGFILISDQLTKYFARVYKLSSLNLGGVFGILDSKAWIPLTSFLLTFILFYYFKKKPDGIEKIGWIIIFFSGLSNLADRLIFGGVVDWIYYPVINVVGNLADIYLGIGLVVLIWSEIKSNHRLK